MLFIKYTLLFLYPNCKMFLFVIEYAYNINITITYKVPYKNSVNRYVPHE